MNAAILTSRSAQKTIYCVHFNIEQMLKRFGPENCAFMTVTLKERIYDAKEAKAAIDRILRAVIRPRYSHYIGVLERHDSGAIHYHFVVHVGRNIRRGFSWAAFRRQQWFKLPKVIRDEVCCVFSTAAPREVCENQIQTLSSCSQGD